MSIADKNEDKLRRIFDTVPEEFDRSRPRYCAELFTFLISEAGIGRGSSVLELGPGTGQATEPVLNTGCNYTAIELGKNFTRILLDKYGGRPHFRVINDDFITYDFGKSQYDLIYSAATIQWIPEEIAFAKTLSLLKPGGMLAMMITKSDFKSQNPELFDRIQGVYSEWFKPEIEYSHRSFCYENAVNYGYTDFKTQEFDGERVLTAEEYVGLCKTHCDHIVLPEPCKTRLFDGLYKAVKEAGDRIVFRDKHILRTCRRG